MTDKLVERPLLVTIREAMKILAVGHNKIFELFRAGALKRVSISGPKAKPGGRGSVRISRAELEILVELARAGQGLFDPAVINQMKALRGEPLEESSSNSTLEVSALEGR